MIKAFDIKSNEVSIIRKFRASSTVSSAGTDAVKTSKNTKIARKPVLPTIGTQPNAIMKPKLSNSAIPSKRTFQLIFKHESRPIVSPNFQRRKRMLIPR